MKKLMLFGVLLLIGCTRVSPPPVPPPTPTPTPIPAPTCVLPVLTVGLDRPPMMKATVEAAEAAVGTRCGSDPYATLKLLAAEIIRAGQCAAADGDAVFVKTPDGMWEEWHAVAFTTGCWKPRAYIGVWS